MREVVVLKMTIKKYKEFTEREKRIHKVEKGQRVDKYRKDLYNMAEEYFNPEAFDDFDYDNIEDTQTH